MNSRRLDVATGTTLIVFACLVLAYSTTFPPAKGTDFGPSLFPRVVTVMLLVLGTVLLLQTLRPGVQSRSRTTDSAGEGPAPAAAGLRNVGVTIVAIVVYVAVVDWTGFIPATIAFLFVLMKTYGLSVPRSIVAACLITGFVYVLFSVLLRVTLP